MISLAALADLTDSFREDLGRPVAPLLVDDRTFDTDTRPAIMGCLNLSRDSTYRESFAPSTESAVRKGLVLAAQGADFVDVGAESSTLKAARVGAGEQIAALVPVVEQLTAEGVTVSVETYHPIVAQACLKAGAQILNYSGAQDDAEMFDLAARFNATVVLCYVRGANVRDATDVVLGADPLPETLDHFAARIDVARRRGVDRVVLDPGVGFSYGNLTNPTTRVRHQTRVILNAFRLRRLGLPICHALPHAFDLFEDQYRIAEGFFAVLAHLGGAGVYRTHEVAHVAAVVRSLIALDLALPGDPGGLPVPSADG